MFSDYPDHQPPINYESVYLSNNHIPHMYSQSFYDEEVQIVAPYQLGALQHNSSGSISVTGLDIPSPPILTAPFHPPPAMLQHLKPSEVITGLPGMSGLVWGCSNSY